MSEEEIEEYKTKFGNKAENEAIEDYLSNVDLPETATDVNVAFRMNEED